MQSYFLGRIGIWCDNVLAINHMEIDLFEDSFPSTNTINRSLNKIAGMPLSAVIAEAEIGEHSKVRVAETEYSL